MISNGHIGIAPEASRNGDTVCILEGASSPCILRQGLHGSWILVSGDCQIFHPEYNDNEGLYFRSDWYLEDQEDGLEEFKIC